MKMIRFNKNMARNEEFYKLYKFLFREPFLNLSNNARVAYTILKDRMALSVINYKDFSDEDGNIYVIYKRADLMKILGLSDRTVYRVLQELKKHGLLEEESQYSNLPKRLYLLTPSQSITATAYDNRNRKNDGSEIVKLTGPYIKNKTNNNKTYIISPSVYNKYNNGEDKDGQDMTQKQKKETCISTPPIDIPIDYNLYNKSITLCVENYKHPRDEQTRDLNAYLVQVYQDLREEQKNENKGEILVLEPCHIAFVANNIVKKAKNIKNIRKYTETCLKNVRKEYNIYLQNSCKINPKEAFKGKTEEDFLTDKFLKELKQNDKG